MEQRFIQPAYVACAALAFGTMLAAQTVTVVSPAQPKVREFTPMERAIPFSLEARSRDPLIEFRTIDQMTEKDRDLVADAESSIGERTGFLGIDFNAGTWNYEQVVCPALPHHVLLRYTRNNGVGDVSVFSASIPRSADGRVRIIPIQMRGYSLFSPAPVNAMAITAFNRIRSEEHFDSPPDWLATGLCYAALTGGRPISAASSEPVKGLEVPLTAPPQIQIQSRNNVVVSFEDLVGTPRPMRWTLAFDLKGNLLKTQHQPAGVMQTKVLHPASINAKEAGGQPTR